MTCAAKALRARHYPAMLLAALLSATALGAAVAQEVPGFMDVVAGAPSQPQAGDVGRLDEGLWATAWCAGRRRRPKGRS
jgi:hypothetical protein